MKYFLRFIYWFFFILVLLVGGGWIYLWKITPDHSGEVKLPGLQSEVQVDFDDFGIPHIQAENKEDLYRTFGYVHAQDRLFQMEMMRRVGSGTLSEVLGKELLEADLLFRTIGIPEDARRNAERIDQADQEEEYYLLLQAYLDGVNRFIETGPKPIEFSLMGIPKKKFTTYDLYCIAGYMSYTFNLGQKTDPVVTRLFEKLGAKYLEDLGMYEVDSAKANPGHDPGMIKFSGISSSIDRIMESLPVSPFMGSNSWAVSGDKTASGKVMLSNDTHIGYSQPAVWYEAHLSCPGFNFYGNFLAGIPFALVGHSEYNAWGLTILEQDDCDFYREYQHPENPLLYQSADGWKEFDIRSDTIKIKGAKDTVIEIKSTYHGPVVNSAFNSLQDSVPISMWWDYLKFDNNLFDVFHGINNSQSISEMQHWISRIHAPGLNIIYGDREGNIAWWTAAKLLKRPEHVQSKFILDGTTGEDDPLGYHPFSYNPKSINPPWGYVYSANDQPAHKDSSFYPGYYKPEHRATRIKQLLEPEDQWNTEKMKAVITDVKSPVDSAVSADFLRILKKNKNWTELEKEGLNALLWDGQHDIDDVSPTVYYRLLYYTLQATLADELGEEDFKLILKTHLIKRGYPLLIKNPESRWWNDQNTNEVEDRQQILEIAFSRTVKSLTEQFGADVSEWQWKRVHTLEIEHPLGKVKAMRPFFNIGPHPVPGGYETINQADFLLDDDGQFQVRSGPQMRIIIDFADVKNSISISPSGQSGHVYSSHYSDQAAMYRQGKFRPQSMKIPEGFTNRMKFLPR